VFLYLNPSSLRFFQLDFRNLESMQSYNLPRLTQSFYGFKHSVKKLLFKCLTQTLESKFSDNLYESDFAKIRHRLLMSCNSILHIGASTGQEAEEYASLNLRVLWFECLPSVAFKLRNHISNFANQNSIEALLGEFEGKEVEIFLASNNYMSSSIFKFDTKYGSNSQVEHQGSLSLRMKRLENIESHFLDQHFNYWVIDTQGSELGILKGAGNLLQNCNVLEIECSNYSVYDGAPLYEEIEAFLGEVGFVPLLKVPIRFHGNVIFVRSRGA